VVDTTPFIPNSETLRELVACGAGWTLLPSYTVRRAVSTRRIVALKPAGLDHRIPFLLARRPGQPGSRALRAVTDMLRAATANMAGR
jgi:DNA-binding transcriptional LysR family regulator